MKTRDLQRGFTLLELLVALAVFAVMATMAYSGLDQVSRTRALTEQSADQLVELQRAFLFMARDVQEVVDRPIRNDLGESEPALIGDEFNASFLQLTRAGWRNPLPTVIHRSSLQRVAWGLEEDNLVRAYWNSLDRVPDDLPVKQVMLHNVKRVEVKFLAGDNSWKDKWPQTTQSSNPDTPPDVSPPRAVEITVESKNFGKITRLFAIPGKPPANNNAITFF